MAKSEFQSFEEVLTTWKYCTKLQINTRLRRFAECSIRGIFFNLENCGGYRIPLLHKKDITYSVGTTIDARGWRSISCTGNSENSNEDGIQFHPASSEWLGGARKSTTKMVVHFIEENLCWKEKASDSRGLLALCGLLWTLQKVRWIMERLWCIQSILAS